MPDIDEFLAELSSKDPVPGGGSVAALEVAMGAALISMVCELTAGKAAYAEVADEIEDIRGAAVSSRDDARQLIDVDAAAFAKVAEAMKLPRQTDEEKAVRREVMQQALKDAVEPPLQTMRVASGAMPLAVRLAAIGNKNAISDVGSGALALRAGFFAAKLNVDINLAIIRDEAFVQEILEQIPDIEELDTMLAEVVQKVGESIGAPS
jgi:methenyltetrahydrofolate cyclohydrolase